jgi:hypothetical protein
MNEISLLPEVISDISLIKGSRFTVSILPYISTESANTVSAILNGPTVILGKSF